MTGPGPSSEDGTNARPAELSGSEYDRQWRVLSDYIRFHPGARHRRRLILDWVRDLGARRILDAGCGPGELIALFSERLDLDELVGCDIATERLARNREVFPNARFHELDVSTGHLDERFDLVVSSEVVEHIADQRAALGHLARMVAPGGHLLISCPTGPIYETERHFGHVHHPTVPELVSATREQGLELVRSKNWGWPTYRALKFATNVNAEWAIDRFAERDYGLGARTLSSFLYWLNFLNLDSERGVNLFALFRRPG